MSAIQSDDLARRLGEHMREGRAANNVTLEAAANRIGKDLQQWHRWESGETRNPTLKNLLLIADAMETELPDLLADLYWPDGKPGVTVESA